MRKYEDYFNRMTEQNKKLFDEFRLVHDEYALNPEANQEKYNKIGSKVQDIIREWENKYCMQSEKAGYGSYTIKLAEKFKDEIRRHFPKIDNIGIIRKTPVSDQDFVINKINL